MQNLAYFINQSSNLTKTQKLSSFPYALKTPYQCISFYVFVMELLSIALVLYDCLALRSMLADAAGYLSRMPLAFFTKLSNLNIHLVRLMTWVVIVF